jgi:hypothetical protein
MLVFEKPAAGVQISFEGMSEQQAVEHLLRINQTLPLHPSSINLGCGPEPEGCHPEPVRLAISALLSVPVGEALSAARISFAKQTGAWFYWLFAGAAARQDLTEKLGWEAATDIIHADDRTQYSKLRADKVRWVMKERFSVDV